MIGLKKKCLTCSKTYFPADVTNPLFFSRGLSCPLFTTWYFSVYPVSLANMSLYGRKTICKGCFMSTLKALLNKWYSCSLHITKTCFLKPWGMLWTTCPESFVLAGLKKGKVYLTFQFYQYLFSSKVIITFGWKNHLIGSHHYLLPRPLWGEKCTQKHLSENS